MEEKANQRAMVKRKKAEDERAWVDEEWTRADEVEKRVMEAMAKAVEAVDL